MASSVNNPKNSKRTKNQKVSDDDDGTAMAYMDEQGVEKFRDVVAVGGVDLVKEQELMLVFDSGPNPKLAFQEKLERPILERNALQRKVARIMGRSGLRVSIHGNVEKCLTMCVEERMRRFICDAIRLSKVRVDTEKSRHRRSVSVSTSDVKQEIMILNKRARDRVDDLQGAGARKEQKLNETRASADKCDDKTMRTAAANVAALAALGGHDIFAKWRLAADQLEKHRGKGGVEGSGNATGSSDRVKMKHKKNQVASEVINVEGKETIKGSTRRISVKDVISVLEMEPQMSKSTLFYSLLNATARSSSC